MTIRIRQGNDIYTGRGADSDICVASARAYLHAVNRLVDRVSHAAQEKTWSTYEASANTPLAK